MKNLFRLFVAAMLLSIALPQQAMAVTITAIYGGGNPDSYWDSFTAGNTQIGLRGKVTGTGATPNNGSGLYTMAPGTPWQIEASFNSDFSGVGGTNLGNYSYSWTVSGPGIAGGSVTFSPAVYIDNSYGNNGTLNGAGVEGTFGSLSGSNNIMQLSQKITFGPFSGNFNTEGLYTLSGSISDLNGRVINSGSVNIQVGEGNIPSAPDGGTSLSLMALALGGIGFARRFILG